MLTWLLRRVALARPTPAPVRVLRPVAETKTKSETQAKPPAPKPQLMRFLG